MWTEGCSLIPDGISCEEATFHEPLGCVIRAQRIVSMRPGQCVLVIGSGMGGLLSLHLARISGASRILTVDIVPFRLESAKRFGADEAITPSEDISACLRQLNNGRLADLVIVCTGAEEAQIQALESVERGGTVLFFASTDPEVRVPISINELFFRNDITLTTSYGSSPFDSWQALEMIRSSLVKVKDMITDRLPLDQTARGFQLVAQAQDSMKVIIEPQK